MTRKLLAATFTLALTLAAPLSHAQQSASNPGKGLAIGQNPKLLQYTRDSDAGAGNGNDLVRSCKFNFGGSAHNMAAMCTSQEIDPGNSHDHNQSPECDYIKCAFDPHGA
ncbi:MAG: hypothetical protein FIB06_09760 [Betaproteobacteria bacterium]|nr:hypothetical protein [Betaproteobacteria bacterium]